MSTITSLGLGSGLDAESLVTQLVSIEKQPITKLQSTNSDLNTRISTWGKLQSAFSTLKDAANALTKSDNWAPVAVSSADATVVSAVAGSGAKPGNYSVAVQSLAASQYIASSAVASGAATVGTGTLRIELGTWNDATTPPGFTPGSKAAVDITIDSANATLDQIRAKINAADAGVSASIVTDASGSRLVLKGASGEASGFRVSVTDDDGTPADAAGLSRLAYDPSSSASQMTRTQSAANARATINGIAVSSSTNQLTNVLDGLTMTLGKVSASPVDVNVTQDTDAIRKNIDTFVSAYNDLVGSLRVQTLYDEASKTAGPLQGDAGALSLQRQLRSLAAATTSASSVYTRLPQVGFEIAKDGRISVNSTKLKQAMTDNLGELKKLFATSDGATEAGNGLAERFRKLASSVLDSDGPIAGRTDSLRASVKRNEKKIDALTDHADQVEKRLRAQYSALDTKMASLNALSSYVSKQITAWTA